MISQPSFIPGKQFKGISTNSSLSPEPSSSDNWEAPSLDPQGNYKATVENGEDEKKKKNSQSSTKWKGVHLSLLLQALIN